PRFGRVKEPSRAVSLVSRGWIFEDKEQSISVLLHRLQTAFLAGDHELSPARTRLINFGPKHSWDRDLLRRVVGHEISDHSQLRVDRKVGQSLELITSHAVLVLQPDTDLVATVDDVHRHSAGLQLVRVRMKFGLLHRRISV